MASESSTRGHSPGTDLHDEHEGLRIGLRRANVASVLILILLVALAFGFVWHARQSAQEAERANAEATRANAEAARARQATARAEDELWNTRLNEARARRIAGGPGARIEAAAIVRELVRRPDLSEGELLAVRQEAIAQLALVDVTPATNWIEKDTTTPLSWDGSLTRYVRHRLPGGVEVHEHPSARLLASFRAPGNLTPRASVFTPDGRLVATRFSGSDVLVWELESKQLLLKSQCRPAPGISQPLMASPDSRALAMLTDKGLAIQPLATNAIARLLQPGRVARGAVFTQDARKLAVLLANQETTVEVWDVRTGATIDRFDVGFRIWTFEWHPDGRRLAVSGDHGRLGIWDVAPRFTGSTSPQPIASTDRVAPREMLRLEGHVSAVDFTMFTPDGSGLLTHAYDKMSIMWDVTSGQRLLAETRVNLLWFNGTGNRIVGMADHQRLEMSGAFHPRTGFRTVAWTLGPRSINGVWLSPDSRLLVVAHPGSSEHPRGESRVWDFARGVEIARMPGIWAQFSRDGRALFTFEVGALRRHELTPELLDGTANWPAGEIFLEMARGDSANAGAVSADGRTLALGAINSVKLIDLESKATLRQFNARTHDTELSPDGSLLGTRYHNQPGCLRNPTNGTVLTQMVGVVEFVFSPDNRWILAKGTDRLRLIDPKSLAVVRELPLALGAGFPPSTAFSPDGKTLAVVHNRFDVRLIELETGRELATFSPPHPAQVAWSHGLVFSQDGRWLVMAKQDGEVVAWELPVVRTALARLGLDWGAAAPRLRSKPSRSTRNATNEETRGNSQPSEVPVLAPQSLMDSARQRLPVTGRPALTIALGAVALALTAGLFISLHQRRMVTAYIRADALALEQRRKLQAAQEELQHSQKMRALGTLAAGIAHDFNNLLSVIRLSNQLAAEQTNASGPARENLNAIESAVAQGETIVQSMLGYSRTAAESEDEYSVTAAVSETVAMLGKKFLSGIVLQLEVQTSLPPVRGVRGRLEQILLNLVVNASEAMNGRGTLRLSAGVVTDAENCILKPGPARRYVAVSVGDSGPGIPADVLPRVFEPFFTTKNAGVQPGTGLGLSTVYTMAEQDGLGLSVETSARAGTTFRILIPVSDKSWHPSGRPSMDERKMPSAAPAGPG